MKNNALSEDVAKKVADDLCLSQGFDFNLLAVLIANAVCEGKDKREIDRLCHFLNLLCCALRSYEECK